MPKVKGLAFRSVLNAQAYLRGQDSLEQLYGSLSQELARTLRGLVASSWYTIENYVALWEGIQRQTGNDPDYPRVVGRRCIEQDLNIAHRLAFLALNTATMIDISMRLFNGYYDTGHASTRRIDERTLRVIFEGCLGFSAPMWTELRGALEMFAEKGSKQPARATLQQGGRSGDASCIVVLTW